MSDRGGPTDYPSPERLEQALRSDDPTSAEAALRSLADPTIDPQTVGQALPAALPWLSHPNAYYQQLAASTLRGLASQRPALIEEHIPELVERFEEDADHADDIVEILAQVIDRESYSLDVDVVDSLTRLLRDSHDTGTRRAICRLMGNGISLRAAEKLHETHEVDPLLKGVAQEELEQMAESAIESVSDGDERWVGEAEDALGYLARSHPSALDGRAEDLAESLGRSQVDIASVLASYVRHTETDTTQLEGRLLDIIQAEEGLSEASRSRSEAALHSVVEIGVPEEDLHRLVERFEDWLSGEEMDRRIHAADQLIELGSRYPEATVGAQSELAAVLTADDPDLVSAARRAFFQTVPRDHRSLFGRLISLAEATDADSFVEGLGVHLGILRYRDDIERGDWETISLGCLGTGILAELRRRVREGQAAQIVLPRYSPEASVTIALELLGSKTTDDARVAMFSPGSRVHWGWKKQMKREYARYGLANAPDSAVVDPMPEVVPIARIQDDGTIADYDSGPSSGRYIITRSLDELQSVSQDDLDAIVLNLTSITRPAFDESLEAVFDRFDVPVVAVYSAFTKHEGDGYPRYGPPDGLQEAEALPGFRSVEAMDTADGPPEGRGGQSLPLYVDNAHRRLVHSRTIEIIGVDSGGLSETFDKVYSISGDLRDAGLDRAGGKIFSVQFTLERLPVPADAFDNRINERQLQGERFLPWKTEKYIDNLQEYASRVDDLRVPDMAFRASGHLREVRDELAEANPLYERLKSVLEEASEAGARATVLTYKGSWADVIEATLRGDEEVDGGRLATGQVRVVGPDEARGLSHPGWVIITGPLPSKYGGFYSFPTAERTIVLTYEGSWDRMIGRHADDFIERMNDAIAGLDDRPYVAPTIDVDWVEEAPAVTPEAEEPEPAGPPASHRGEEPAPGRTTPRERRRDRLEALAEAFESTVDGEFQAEHGTYDGDTYRTYEVVTTEGTEFTLHNQETYLRRRPDGNHHWVSPGALSAGDTVAIIDPDVESELWREHLEDLYSEEFEGATATEGVRSWYDALSEIVRANAETRGVAADSSANLDDIARTARGSGVDRAVGTIKGWFSSVLVADDALDLARDSSLRIGPRRTADIRDIGEAFGVSELAEHAEMIEASMRAVRSLNRSEGMAFREELLELVDSDEENSVSASLTHHEIASIGEPDSDVEEEE